MEIDALTAGCRFNGEPIEPLFIACEVQHWLLADLAAQEVPVEAIRSAILEARLAFAEVASRARVTKSAHFGADGRHVGGPTFHRCAIACKSELVTDEAVYVAEYDDVEEWPDGWPDAEPDGGGR